MSIQQQRIKFTSANKRLKRARRLYVFICRRAWLQDPNGAMKRMGKRMSSCGLYAEATTKEPRSLRFRICRHLWKLSPEYSDSFGWSRWCHHNGLDNNFNRVDKKIA